MCLWGYPISGAQVTCFTKLGIPIKVTIDAKANAAVGTITVGSVIEAVEHVTTPAALNGKPRRSQGRRPIGRKCYKRRRRAQGQAARLG